MTDIVICFEKEYKLMVENDIYLKAFYGISSKFFQSSLKNKNVVKIKTQSTWSSYRQPTTGSWRNPKTIRLPISALIRTQL